MTYALIDQLGQDTGQRAATFEEASETADALGWRVVEIRRELHVGQDGPGAYYPALSEVKDT